MRRKHLVALLSVVLIVAVSIGATFAYLTDKDSNTNTFTVGNVQLELDETDVNPDGTLKSDKRVEGNEYHLLPGQQYIKDPTVTVKANSEDAYVRMLIKVENIDKLTASLPKETAPDYYGVENEKQVFLLQKLVTGWDNATWEYVGYKDVTETITDETSGTTTTVKTGVYEFRYHSIVSKAPADKTLDSLFDTIIVPGEIDNEHLAHLSNVKIIAVAHAIQSVGFTDADAAWDAFTE